MNLGVLNLIDINFEATWCTVVGGRGGRGGGMPGAGYYNGGGYGGPGGYQGL